MPYKFEYNGSKIKEKDKRNIKLFPEDKEEIKRLYSTGNYSQYQLAELYNVDRSTIGYCVNSERYNKMKEDRKRNRKKYYDKEKHKEYMKKYREHKRKLYLENKLVKKCSK